MRWLERLSPRLGFLLLGLGAWGLVAAGFVIQEWDRLNPCPLCIFQRVLYLLFGALALLGALLPLGPRGQKAWGLGLAGVSLGGFLTALYQTTMQAVPGLVAECSYTDQGPIELFVDWLGMQYPTLFMATGLCSSREWEFLGLSMANWSLLCFLGFGLAALILSRCWGLLRRPA